MRAWMIACACAMNHVCSHNNFHYVLRLCCVVECLLNNNNNSDWNKEYDFKMNGPTWGARVAIVSWCASESRVFNINTVRRCGSMWFSQNMNSCLRQPYRTDKFFQKKVHWFGSSVWRSTMHCHRECKASIYSFFYRFVYGNWTKNSKIYTS